MIKVLFICHALPIYDKSFIHLPRQDKRVDCILPQHWAVLGQITAYKKAQYYGIATNEVLEPKI